VAVAALGVACVTVARLPGRLRRYEPEPNLNFRFFESLGRYQAMMEPLALFQVTEEREGCAKG
jgi:hypothetical protein